MGPEKRLRVQQAKREARSNRAAAVVHWNELLDASGQPREIYEPLFRRFASATRGELKRIDEQLEATMREMGVTFDIPRDSPWGRRPWFCDLLPQVFTAGEWRVLAGGMAQRLHAYECFLRDVYGEQRILRQGIVPLQPVLGSPYFQRAARALKPPGGRYLHLSGMAVGRAPDGRMVVKHHYFSHASGMSYMIQNRRAMARVLPQAFLDYSIHSVTEATTDILEVLRGYARDAEPTIVLLSPGQGSAAYSEHSFLARRMGIPLVQGGDLIVLNDHVYLKTVSGLERIEVIYSRVSDTWLDPLVFRRDSLLGVPGIVQCIRQGTVAVVNAVGSQLMDDRAMLPFAPALIRYYLGETPLLDDLDTYWLGDLDQREVVLNDLPRFIVRPIYGERILTPDESEPFDERRQRAMLREILENPAGFVAQPRGSSALTLCYESGRPRTRHQDHILFALHRDDGDCAVFPGALTRVAEEGSFFTASELGGGSKDTWVEIAPGTAADAGPRPARDVHPPSRHVTSRVAEAFYWTGRYLDRARNLAAMIAVIESLETEELNSTERTLYRPIWNRMLPPLEGGRARGESISSVGGRYRLTFDPAGSGSVWSSIERAANNAESILECLSNEAGGTLSRMRSLFAAPRRHARLSDAKRAALTRRTCEQITELVAQFFGMAQTTMIADGGWRFCEIGERVERAAITANALATMTRSLLRTAGPAGEHAREIQLSAFLRLLNCRDAYRRVYQMRIEPGPVFQMLWQNPMVPRSVNRCLTHCRDLLARSQSEAAPGLQRTLAGIEALRDEVLQTDWDQLAEREIESGAPGSANAAELAGRVNDLLDHTLAIHHLIADGFLNHQIHMRAADQPLLTGFSHAV
ncbi:MAG: circularly permuted type 2 ATP-grasp protein [Terrimicrobiaceae bacterium]|nr:circularly permuted type 2 ATP-grasp protein [Terrimicrobiaceae bacterium]